MAPFGSQPSGSGFSFGASSQPSASASSSAPKPFSFGNPSAPKNPTPLFSSFSANSIPSATASSVSGNDMAVDSQDYEDEDEVDTAYFTPAAFPTKGGAKWRATGRGMMAALSPVGGEITAWVAKQPSDDPSRKMKESPPPTTDYILYKANLNSFPASVHNLYQDTYPLFTSLQHIIASRMRLNEDGLLGPPDAETIVYMRRLVDLYLEELAKLRDAPDLDNETAMIWEEVQGIFQLATILYLPQDGRGEGLVGEELLDWVNAVDVVQLDQQGNEIMQTKEPWEHPTFWPYIVCCILRGFFIPASTFLGTLATHPHPPIARLGKLLQSHVKAFPRSTSVDKYALDYQFQSAHKMWLAKFRAELATFIGGRSHGHWLDEDGSSGRSKWAEWDDGFRSVVELMEGKKERVLEEAQSWREAMGAWGVLVDVSLRRDDLTSALKQITEAIPVDSTLLPDSIQSSICRREIDKALSGCHQLNTWLAAHLGDVFDKLELVDDNDKYEYSFRDYFLLEYADSIMDSSSEHDLWRVVAQYFAAAGEEGRNRLREFIVRVSVRLTPNEKGKDKAAEAEDGMEVEGSDSVVAQFQDLIDLRAVCQEFDLKAEFEMIGQIVAERLVRRGDLGQAAAICLMAENGFTLSRIAEKILTAYVEQGPEKFLELVGTLPAQALYDNEDGLFAELAVTGNSEGDSRSAMAMYAARLQFLSDLRDYLLFLKRDDRERAAARLYKILTAVNTPVEFWSVLLADSVELLEDQEILFGPAETMELMRVLEDVLANARFASGDYLRQLWRYIQRQEKGGLQDAKPASGKAEDIKQETEIALQRLELVRLALARNLSRAMVAGLDD